MNIACKSCGNVVELPDEDVKGLSVPIAAICGQCSTVTMVKPPGRDRWFEARLVITECDEEPLGWDAEGEKLAGIRCAVSAGSFAEAVPKIADGITGQWDRLVETASVADPPQL